MDGMTGVVWFVIGIVFFLMEMIAPAFVLLFFGMGAWGAAIVSLYTPVLEIQVICFITASMVALITLRNRYRSLFSGKSRMPSGQTEHPMTGRTGIVIKDILPNATGEISCGGSYWKAVSDGDIPAWSHVKVIGAQADDGIVLRVALMDKN
jgi:membrane protein implicated in regulation of membrane protease activity